MTKLKSIKGKDGYLIHKDLAISISQEIEQDYLLKREVVECILKHKDCIRYHELDGHNATCLDMVLRELGGSA